MADVSRSVHHGVGSGLLAGATFAVAQVIAAVTSGAPAVIVFRRSASVLLGPAALTTTPTAIAVVVGLIAHVYLSTIYGLSYGVYNSALSAPSRHSAPRQAAIGALYGVVLWLVNLELFARIVFPWLLAVSQPVQVFLHAACFGLPLGLRYAAAERDAWQDQLPVAIATVRRTRRTRRRRCRTEQAPAAVVAGDVDRAAAATEPSSLMQPPSSSAGRCTLDRCTPRGHRR